MDTIPSADEWLELAMAGARDTSLEEDRSRWDAKAPSFAHKKTRSGYIEQLVEMMDLREGETVLDMGCGPGLVSVALAKAGHQVYAADFSTGMLAELEKFVEAEALESMVHPYCCAWQDDWDELPEADVVLSSRSMTTRNVADSVAKMESKARRKVVVSLGAGELPWADLKLLNAIGRSVTTAELSEGFIQFLNWLLTTFRNPEVRYITTERQAQSESSEELYEHLKQSVMLKPEEQEAFDAFIHEHMKPREDGGAIMDYARTNRWAVISWDVERV